MSMLLKQLIAYGAATAGTMVLVTSLVNFVLEGKPLPNSNQLEFPVMTEHGFLSLDRDHDGLISRPEADLQPGLVRKFRKLDFNRDGVLNHSEFVAFEYSTQLDR